jgi:hypothetical protein
MNPELKHLVHFYNDPQYLFKTITMSPQSEYSRISKLLVDTNSWYCFRYSNEIREAYYKRRIYLEKRLKAEFEANYYHLVSDIPIYFYVIPNITKDEILKKNETIYNNAKYVSLIDMDLLFGKTNITFTINDSFRSYQQAMLNAGLPEMLNEPKYEIFPDSSQVFPLDELDNMSKKYKTLPVKYEVQIWDHEILNIIKRNMSVLEL